MESVLGRVRDPAGRDDDVPASANSPTYPKDRRRRAGTPARARGTRTRRQVPTGRRIAPLAGRVAETPGEPAVPFVPVPLLFVGPVGPIGPRRPSTRRRRRPRSTPTPFGERAGLHGRPGGRRFLEVARVRLVHLVEVVDVGEEDGRFEHVRRICARLVEHGHEVVEGCSVCSAIDASSRRVAVRRQRDLASCEHGSPFVVA